MTTYSIILAKRTLFRSNGIKDLTQQLQLSSSNKQTGPRLLSSVSVNSHLHSSTIPQRQTHTESFQNQHNKPGAQATSHKQSFVKPYVDPKFSYVFGRSQKQLRYLNVAKCFEDILPHEKQNTACVFYDEGISRSYEQLYTDVNRLVIGLFESLNLRRGDQVGVYAFNCYNWLLIQYACAKLGLVLVAINPAYRSEELGYLLKQTKIKALFVPGNNSSQQSLNDHWAILKEKEISKLDLPYLKHTVILDGQIDNSSLPFTKSSNNVKFHNWISVFRANSSGELRDEIKDEMSLVTPDDIYGIYQTSGTTGYPKGAVISQFTAINNTQLSYQRLFNERQPEFENIRHNVCLPLPLFHEFAGVLGVLAPFCVKGGSFVFIGKKYNISSVVKAIQRFNCNVIFLTPTILIDLLDYVEQKGITDLPLKMILGAGSMVLPELVDKTYSTLKNLEQFVIVYGSSEHGVLASAQSINEPRESRSQTVGTPIDFCQVRIADIDTNETKLLGEKGEVQTRGFNTMIEYYGNEEKTDESITKCRWFKTGDMGVIDKETGSLRIVGRLKDMIIKGGENVYPAEVERILHEHPAVNDAQVFGIPHDRYGEEVCAWIKLRDEYKFRKDYCQQSTLNEISEFCKQKLTYFKVPKPKYMRIVDSYPLTAVKKIKKFELRNSMIEQVKRVEEEEAKKQHSKTN